MAYQKRAPTAVVADEVTFMDNLMRERPYMNKITYEVRYLSLYELLGIRMFPKSEYKYSDWDAIEETKAVKVLYGKK